MYIVYRYTVYIYISTYVYGVASLSRIDEIICLFCQRALLKRPYSAKETYNLIDPTNRSRPMCIHMYIVYISGYVYIYLHVNSI